MARRASPLAKKSLVVQPAELARLVKLGGYRNESEAVRAAVAEGPGHSRHANRDRSAPKPRHLWHEGEVKTLLDTSIWIPYLKRQSCGDR